MPTVSAVIVGNELLTGKFPDENGSYLIGRLRTLGADLARLVFVRDVVPELADEVRRCADRSDVVLTSGGVGPTHDDVTLMAVAAAFDLPMVRDESLVALIGRWGLPVDEGTLRMATVPAGTEALVHGALSFPVLRCRNVWVLPGPPKLFRERFEVIAPRLAGPAVHTARVYTDEHETAIAPRLTAIALRHPAVDIGSYPRWGEGNYRVILTLESRDPAALALAHRELAAAVSVVRLEEPG